MGGVRLGLFTDGDDEDDELIDFLVLNEISKQENTSTNSSHSGGGCLTCFLLMMAVPIGAILITASVLM